MLPFDLIIWAANGGIALVLFSFFVALAITVIAAAVKALRK